MASTILRVNSSYQLPPLDAIIARLFLVNFLPCLTVYTNLTKICKWQLEFDRKIIYCMSFLKNARSCLIYHKNLSDEVLAWYHEHTIGTIPWNIIVPFFLFLPNSNIKIMSKTVSIYNLVFITANKFNQVSSHLIATVQTSNNSWMTRVVRY